MKTISSIDPMTSQKIVTVQNVSKTFKLPHERSSSIKGLILHGYKKSNYDIQTVLKNINFDVYEGEFFGIVGRNGSGKSTLLKLLAGIYSPNKGSVTITGKLTPFIELGVGFNPELTGRENVFLNGALLGFTRKEMNGLYDDIVSFAELERFMDQKLKNYSSGMQVRLAFSIAIQAQSDILLIDEVLAVGDASFQRKCFDYFRSLKKNKQTVVFVSHDMNAVREYCDRAILLDGGKIIASGDPDTVSQQYTRLFQTTAKTTNSNNAKRWGNGEFLIESVDVSVEDKKVTILASYLSLAQIEHPIFGVSIVGPTGVKLLETNTLWDKVKTGIFEPNQRVDVSWSFPNILPNGTSSLTLAVASSDASVFYDWWDEARIITIDKETASPAVTIPPVAVKVTRK
jgi:ABC-2 type transport system ATP-binding protein